MKLTLPFQFEKETKSAVRYQELGPSRQLAKDDGTLVVGTLYIRKSALPTGGWPQKLIVEIRDE